ncbi:MAG: ester cyclase [Pirellulaceae bacterium]
MQNRRSTKTASVIADGAKIVLLRQQAGWTQQDLACQSGYSERLIRKLENQLPIRPSTLGDIVHCLHERLGLASWDLSEYCRDLPMGTGEGQNTESSDAASRLQEYVETVFVQRRIDHLPEFISPTIQFRAEGASLQGIEIIEQRARAFLDGFNPIEFQFERIIETGNTAIGNWHVNMQHTGTFLEIPATNRWVSVRGSFIATYVDGLCVEAEDQFDVESIIRQIRDEPQRTILPSD